MRNTQVIQDWWHCPHPRCFQQGQLTVSLKDPLGWDLLLRLEKGSPFEGTTTTSNTCTTTEAICFETAGYKMLQTFVSLPHDGEFKQQTVFRVITMNQPTWNNYNDSGLERYLSLFQPNPKNWIINIKWKIK